MTLTRNEMLKYKKENIYVKILLSQMFSNVWDALLEMDINKSFSYVFQEKNKMPSLWRKELDGSCIWVMIYIVSFEIM